MNSAIRKYPKKQLAFIDESLCIGCTKCIQACPVDAIIGAAKQMHTILVTECIGCKLCLPPCPMDCIHLTEHPDLNYYANYYRQRHQNQVNRKEIKRVLLPEQKSTQDKKQEIMEAIRRAKQKRQKGL